MNCDEYERRLGDYVDGTLAADGAARLEAHLAGCARCQAIAADVDAIRLMARSLEPHAAPPQVWRRVAEATAPARPRRALLAAFSGWQSLAAAATMVILVSSLWWTADRLASVAPPPGAAFAADASAPPMDSARSEAEAQYTTAIASLEEITTAERSALDPGTAEVLQTGMTVIDSAIAESRAALDTNPDSEVAQESLFQALRRKVALLQQMLALINEMRKGNEGGAARIMSELNP